MTKDATNMPKSAQDLPSEQLKPWIGPAILLLDLDAFFASVEQLDHPEWRNKPVIVGGSPQKRGVVSTASYEARKFGVHSAMASQRAAKLCPQAIWAPVNMARYKEISDQVMNILYQESSHLMQVSIDEAFLDISPTRVNTEHPVLVAKRIQEKVSELGISCSIGLGSSKAVAKIASNQDKPCGLTVVYPRDEANFLFPLPTKEMNGIGPVAQKKLAQYGIRSLGELARADIDMLRSVFGKNAEKMRDRCFGIDTPIEDKPRPAKSISNEISLAQSTNDRKEIEALLATAAHKVGRRLRKQELSPSVLHLKLRFEDLSRKSCQKKLAQLGDNELDWLIHLNAMLDELWDGTSLIRLVGVGVSGFEAMAIQTSIFELCDSLTAQKDASESNSQTNKDRLIRTNDAIAEKFGDSSVLFGHELRMRDKTTGTSPKNSS